MDAKVQELEAKEIDAVAGAQLDLGFWDHPWFRIPIWEPEVLSR